MAGVFWHIVSYGVVGLFLVIMAYRIIAIKRQPVHLRWELAPIPHEKGRQKYGGSYLEEYEWWQKPRRKAHIAPIVYMLSEIFLLKGVWKNNRSLWIFSFPMHAGLYLFILTLILYFVNALLIITKTPASVADVLQGITAVTAAAGCILGGLGTVGLIIKRCFDCGLRTYSTFPVYFRLVLLAAVFLTGAAAMLSAGNYADEMSLFVTNIITFDYGVSVSTISSVHVILSLIFIIYLPFTDMAHFVTKYFTYHAVRWDDKPQDGKMAEKLRTQVNQTVGWSAAHVKSDGKKNWADTIGGECIEKENP